MAFGKFGRVGNSRFMKRRLERFLFPGMFDLLQFQDRLARIGAHGNIDGIHHGPGPAAAQDPIQKKLIAHAPALPEERQNFLKFIRPADTLFPGVGVRHLAATR